MDRLTTIEEVITAVLYTIDGTEQPNGYTYYSSTGNVMIDDEVIANAINRSKGQFSAVDYTVEQVDSEENEEWGNGANVYTNSVLYTITAKVKNDAQTSTPKRTIKKRCNMVISDLKYLFAHNISLDGNANWFRYVRSTRRYATSNDIIRTADLIAIFELNYGQSFSNPDIVGCN